MEFLLVKIIEKNTNQLIATCSQMEVFSFPVMIDYAWHVALCRNQMPLDANREDYKFIIREN